MSDPSLAALADEYWDAVLDASPQLATLLGDHRHDDRLEHVDQASLDAHRATFADVAARADAIPDDDLPDPDDRLTRDLLVHEATERVDLLDLEVQTAPIDPFLGIHSDLLQYASQVAAATPEQAERLLARYRQVPRLFDEVADLNRAHLARGLTPAAINAARALAQVERYLDGGLADDPFVRITVPDQVADDWREQMRDVVEEAVRPGFAAHAAFIRDEVLPVARDDDHAGLAHVPDGERLYATLARIHTSLDRSPDRMHEIGVAHAQQDLPVEWAAVGAAALGIDDLPTLFDRLRTDPDLRYDSPEAMVSHAGQIVARAWEAIDGWFNLRPEAPCQVQPAPAALAPSMPPAYYFPPAEDGSRPGTYFINTHAATERARFPYEAIAFHEAIPGHHFDRTLAQELTDVPTFRRYGSATAHAEGWGLYTERLADEMGLYSSELDRLGMLMADAWRAGRLVVDTGLHAQGWTRQQAIDWMLEWTPVGRGVVEQEVDRYIGMPGQALSYMMGRRHIFGLRERAQQALGDDFDIAAFHDAVLCRGGLPLPVLTTSVEEQLGFA